MPTTKERGLGSEHQRTRRRLLPLAYGTPCPGCGEVMLRDQPLDLDHVIPRVMGGIGGPVRMMHRKCNRRNGGKLGNRLKARRRAFDANGPERLEQKPPRWP